MNQSHVKTTITTNKHQHHIYFEPLSHDTVWSISHQSTYKPYSLEVYFRVFTKKAADENNLVGFVQNTNAGTVIGEAEGAASDIANFKHWLEHVGSPNSSVSSVKFETKPITELTYSEFVVERSKQQRFTW